MLKCVANLSLVPILKPFLRRLVELFETVTPPSKRPYVCFCHLPFHNREGRTGGVFGTVNELKN